MDESHLFLRSLSSRWAAWIECRPAALREAALWEGGDGDQAGAFPPQEAACPPQEGASLPQEAACRLRKLPVRLQGQECHCRPKSGRQCRPPRASGRQCSPPLLQAVSAVFLCCRPLVLSPSAAGHSPWLAVGVPAASGCAPLPLCARHPTSMLQV